MDVSSYSLIAICKYATELDLLNENANRYTYRLWF